MSTSRTTLRGSTVVLAAALAALVLVVGPPAIDPASAQGPTGPVEVPLTTLYNSRAIAEDPNSTANFDGGGHAYSATATQLGDPARGYSGLTAGQKITTGGHSFTWPDRVGKSDNVLARGQRVTVPAVAGASELGLLGASVNGPSGGTFLLHYVSTDGDGIEHRTTVSRDIRFTDWTRGQFTNDPLEAHHTIVTKSLFRHMRAGSTSAGYVTHVYVITTPLDPAMTLEAVTLPVSSQIHLFSLSLK